MICRPDEWAGLRSSLQIMQRDADQLLLRSTVLAQNMATLTKIIVEIEYRDVVGQPESDVAKLSLDKPSLYEAHALIEKLKGGGV